MNDSDLISTDKMTDFSHLKHAAKLCARGVRWKKSTISYLNSINRRTIALSEKIADKTYKPSEYHHFSITEPKPRKISSATLEDRIVQRALCEDGVYNQLVSHLNYNNCACQVGKGTSFAAARLARHLKDYVMMYGLRGYVLRIDVRKFFDNISHGFLKYVVDRYITDKNNRDLLFDLIDSFKTKEIIEPTRREFAGIPLGSQLSQLFALCSLDPIDQYIQRELHIEHYVRYMDDIVIIFPDLDTLRLMTKLIVGRMECLGYEANRKTRISPVGDGITFLHIRFTPTRTGRVIRRLERSKFAAERRKLKRMFYNMQFNNDSNVNLGIILRHYQGWRENVIQKLGKNATADMDAIFLAHMQSRLPRFKLGLEDLDGLSKDFITKFCLSSIKPSCVNSLFTSELSVSDRLIFQTNNDGGIQNVRTCETAHT